MNKLFIAFVIMTSLLSIEVQAEILTHDQVVAITKNVLKERDYGLTSMALKDITDFCPAYEVLSYDEKEDFFAHFIAAMAKFESSYNTTTTFRENSGNVSAGLLQISLGSLSSTYKKNGCSVISKESDLKDAKKNIQCGLGIISTLAAQDGYLAKDKTTGASRYWSALRTPYAIYVIALGRTVIVGKKNEVVSLVRSSFSSCQ